ncbi:MAG: tetraacyldisaccharide 4'-kinase [Flavobacteriales bacterium]|nr:tetraacyldisaccharide 4'-kinase [Flavobacteriales bacterium]
MKNVRYLLLPLSILYWVITWIYHELYNQRILRSRKFKIPVISVGNLTTGGTGKTPHVEYIVRLLLRSEQGFFDRVATLSRGYGRATTGFALANEESTAIEIGDEPRQMKQKFKNIFVAVDENRAHGIDKLLTMVPGLDVVLLDDAFQHRRVKPGLSILLRDFQAVSSRMALLPAGDMREPVSGSARADIIIITNSPKMLSPHERRRIQHIVKPKDDQSLLFSFVAYDDLVPALGTDEHIMANKAFYFERGYAILLVTGIADSLPLQEYYGQNIGELTHMKFGDHHEFTMADIQKIRKNFDNIANENKIILTTEKDAMRLAIPGVAKAFENLPIFYLPIKIKFQDDDGKKFNKQIIDYVTKN